MLKTVSKILFRYSHIDNLTTDKAHKTCLPYSSPANRIIAVTEENKPA